MWESLVAGRGLKFHLAGINNQNFIMQDEETGSWWQQVTGEATQGPLKGQRLNAVLHDEISFSIWKQEHPRGRVLRLDESAKRFPEDWEERTAKLPVFSQLNSEDGLSPRIEIIGIKIGNAAKAYPLSAIQLQNTILDDVGDTPVVIVMARDKKSVRAFDRRMDGQDLEFFAKPDSQPPRLFDTQTGSEWDFAGRAVSGKYAGRELKKIFTLKDYWFDWKAYNPDTAVYR